MSTDILRQFSYNGESVRTVVIDGAPWFIANDVCAVLEITNIGNALAALDDDEKGSIHITDGTSGTPVRAIISEPGLYSLTLRSRKPEAKAFKRWITHEVLPEIRRTGVYGSMLPTSFAEALELAASQAKALEQAEERLAEAQPKVEAFDQLMDADGFYSMGAVAKILRIGRNTMFKRLRDNGILMADNLPYQRYAHHFKVVAGTHVEHGNSTIHHTTKVKPSGLAFILSKLNKTQLKVVA